MIGLLTLRIYNNDTGILYNVSESEPVQELLDETHYIQSVHYISKPIIKVYRKVFLIIHCRIYYAIVLFHCFVP